MSADVKQQKHKGVAPSVGQRLGAARAFALQHQKWLYALLLAVVMVLYASIYFNNTFPMSEGWGVNYAELVLHGKLPYRDFYYFLPPLNLLLDLVAWVLSFGSLFMFRVWWFCQRIALFELLFFLFCRYFKPTAAFLGCAFGSILATASGYDLFGDYNQTAPLLSVILIYCAIGFANAQGAKQKCKRMLFAGVVFALLLFNKQTIFLDAVVLYFVVLAVQCILARDKDFWKYLLSVLAGFFLLALPVIIFMACAGMLVPFVEQVFLHTGGKGGLLDIILLRLVRKLYLTRPWLLVALLLVGLKLASMGKENKVLRWVARGLLAAFLVAAVVIGRGQIGAFWRAVGSSWALLVVMVVAALPLVCILVLRLLGRGPAYLCGDRAILAATAFWSVCTLLVGYFADVATGHPALSSIQNSWSPLSLVTDLLYFVTLYYILVTLVSALIRERPRGEKIANNQAMLWIACGAFSTLYASLMASGGELGFHALMIGLPFMLCKGFSLVLQDKVLETGLRAGAMVLCTLLCVICMAQKYIAPYYWWGAGAAEAKSEKTCVTDIPALKGFRFSVKTKQKYEGITKVIRENTDEDDVVYGFPYVKLFNILTDRYQYDTFVPVMFYDVVDDRYVAQENELLKEHLPDILVLHDIPGCMDMHEWLLRDGTPLVQRETLAYFEAVIPEKYELLGVFDDISVYKLLPQQ